MQPTIQQLFSGNGGLIYLISVLLAIINFGLLFFIRAMWASYRDQGEQIRGMQRELASMRETMAGKYVTRDDFKLLREEFRNGWDVLDKKLTNLLTRGQA
ncbi:hypothetical protein PAN31117_05430 [Pandoraea anapnoica]|uniref:Uncharacterized protein n=1 Tax=Pandoraea anapnoica TaxID=2508301 RepID=A0A5E5AUD7_9BURK|nr:MULTISPECIES: hypothetical protein [Pandoraea]VVE15023.1 hypothetical protein PIN31009_02830 [Pandoraea iniqua]VVE76646.1 hypothetical protein PAN31117_05430 [Pandoraea anapnoica]